MLWCVQAEKASELNPCYPKTPSFFQVKADAPHLINGRACSTTTLPALYPADILLPQGTESSSNCTVLPPCILDRVNGTYQAASTNSTHLCYLLLHFLQKKNEKKNLKSIEWKPPDLKNTHARTHAHTRTHTHTHRTKTHRTINVSAYKHKMYIKQRPRVKTLNPLPPLQPCFTH